MPRSIDDFVNEANSDPIGFAWKWIAVLIGVSIVLGIVGFILFWPQQTAEVAKDKFGPQTAFANYEWFKDTAGMLRAQSDNIKNFELQQKQLEEQYKDIPRAKWAREDREQWNENAVTIADTKANYNLLVGQYNANMAKVNFKYTNAGDLPAGSDEVMQREYALYK